MEKRVAHSNAGGHIFSSAGVSSGWPVFFGAMLFGLRDTGFDAMERHRAVQLFCRGSTEYRHKLVM